MAPMEPTPSTPETETLAMPPIVRTPGVCGGRPRIDGHRITVEQIAVWHEQMGMTPIEIAATYPTITLAQVHAALAYYYDHKQEIDADIEEGKRFVEEMKAKSPSLLAEKPEELRAKNPLLGLFADEPDLVDEVVESAMRDRETRPLRLPADG
jgi:uncharacterized protein (DUF433 family)